ncbi:glycosyltransferase family 2 protein [Puniceibacterium sp. IMCC21224]|uniref:glycosyltransferase family 2 protein n=1 Tax=Puniceibacterium sp. IMCC21224 TaxID=1618204 RepID=UPI00064DBB2C|nr:glycosyltransferase family 2 protein [Puniceibacterium sp. IMCC21224]KMK65642.1 putative glycosyltransferase [Puniceibacterium sp. IMCC21224]
MQQPRLLTVVLNYRTPDMTLRAVEAAVRELVDLRAEVVVVDNASGDGSFEKLTAGIARASWGRDVPVRVVASPVNGGFGAGNNFGIRAGLADGSRPDYVYILNSDAFPDPGSIRCLLTHLQTHPDAGFAGSYIHGPEGDAHITAFRFPSILSELEGSARFGPISRLLRYRAVPIGVPSVTVRVDWLAGASMLMRMDVLDEIGLFDEEFFLYFEETDLCLRAARAGHETHYVRGSEVTHIGSVSTGMKTWARMPTYWFDSRWYYFSHNHGRFYAALATLAHATGGLLWRLRRLVQSKPSADPPQFLRDLLLHDFKALTGAPPEKRLAVRATPVRIAAKARAEQPR